MSEDLFGGKPMTQKEKLIASRKHTTDLTKRAIDWMNNTGYFSVHRSNNIPSTRIIREKKTVRAIDQDGREYDFIYDDVKIMFKKGNIKKKILDISGFTTNGAIHIELEVKTGKDQLDEAQQDRINEIKKARGISFVFDSWETFQLQIKPFMCDRIGF